MKLPDMSEDVFAAMLDHAIQDLRDSGMDPRIMGSPIKRLPSHLDL